MRLPVPAAFVALALLVAGCTTPEDTAEAVDETAAAIDAANQQMQAAAGMSQQGSNASMSANANASASSNATANSTANQTQYDHSNCMRGMDMPGCPAAEADRYFDEIAANRPPPDKPLEPILIALDPTGEGQTGAFRIDEGTMKLLVEVHVNHTAMGPWAVVGSAPGEGLRLEFTGGEATESMALGEPDAGVDPALALRGTYRTEISMPAAGDWTLNVAGRGTNAQVDILLVERFYM